MNGNLDAEHYRNHSSPQYTFAQEVLSSLDLKGDEMILDVGCGDGRLTAELSESLPNGHIVGVDPSESMIELASQTSSPNLTFQTGSAEEVSLDVHVDVILILSALHWVRHPEKALQNLASFLKPGGSLYILTYPKESPYWQFLEKTSQKDKWKPYASAYSTILSAQEYKQVLENLGLTINIFSLEEKVATYANAEELRNYIKGWLQCYLPLPTELENAFLDDVIKNTPLKIPYTKLIICSSSPR